MNAWKLAKKDLTLFFRDRVGLLLGLLLPVVLAAIFGTAMGAMAGGGDAVARIGLFVEDRDGSQASRSLVKALAASSTLRVRAIDLEVADRDEKESARGRVAQGDGPAGLLIPAGFGSAEDEAGGVAGGEAGAVRMQLFRDPSKHVENQVLAGSLLPVVLEAGGAATGPLLMLDGLRSSGYPKAAMGAAKEVVTETWERLYALALEAGEAGEASATSETGAHGGEQSDPGADASSQQRSSMPSAGGGFPQELLAAAGLEVENVVGGADAARAMQIGVQAHAVAGIAVMMLLFGLVACGSTLREEEEEGTLDRLRLATTPGAILGGKFLATWLMGLLQLAVLYLVGSFLFDVPILREPVALILLSCATSAAATGFGLFFAATCTTRKQVEGLSTLVILAMSAAGGSWFPLFATPEWFQRLGHFTLNAWAMDGFHGLFVYDRGLGGIALEIGVLCAIAAVLSSIAVLLWNRRLAR